MRGHRVQNKYTINFGKKIQEALRNAKASPLGRGVCAADGEGKPGDTEAPCSDKQFLCQSETIAVSAIPHQRPCPLRRSAPAPPKGEPWQDQKYYNKLKS